MTLTRDQLLAQKLPTERIKVPWINGGDSEVIVRGMPLDAAIRYPGVENKYAFVFVNAVVDEQGKRLFSDADIQTVAESVEPSLLDLVFHVANRLTAIPDERREFIKKNSIPMTTDVSGGSPSI